MTAPPRRNGMRFALALVMLGSVLSLCGCATIVPPKHPVDPVPVYLANYGKHSSILLTDPRGHLNEYAYGDFKWFALNHVSAYDAVRALFFSTTPTIGRRQIAADDDIDSVQRATNAYPVWRFLAPKEKVEHLIEQLDREYDAKLDTVTYNALTGLWYVKAGKHYSAFHNCNHAVAWWFKQIGCDIRGIPMFSGFKVDPQELR